MPLRKSYATPEMVSFYLAGVPLRELADEFSLTYGIARRSLINSGVRLRVRGPECWTQWDGRRPDVAARNAR